MDHLKSDIDTSEAFSGSFQNEMTDMDRLCQIFELLPLNKKKSGNLHIVKGDILIRRQYGHHQRILSGVVEFVSPDEVIILSNNGRKKIRLPKDEHALGWEIRIVKPANSKINADLKSNLQEDAPIAQTPGGDLPAQRQCGFFRLDKTIVTSAALINSIRTLTLTEKTHWVVPGTGNLLFESNPASLHPLPLLLDIPIVN